MVFAKAKANLYGFFILIEILFSLHAQGQTQSHLIYCLRLARTAQVSFYKKNHRYQLVEEKLDELLPPGCAELRFETDVRGKTGFVVLSEANGEMWSLDDQEVLSKIGKGKYTTATAGGSVSSGGGGASAAAASAGADSASAAPATPGMAPPTDAPVAVNAPRAPAGGADAPKPSLATEAAPRSYASDPSSIETPHDGPGGGALASPIAAAAADSSGDDAVIRMNRCFMRENYGNIACVAVMDELLKTCKGGSGATAACSAFAQSMNFTNLADCEGDDETAFGRCEMRIKVLDRKCRSPMQHTTADCHELAKHFAKKGRPLPWALAAEEDEDDAEDNDNKSRYMADDGDRAPASADDESRDLRARELGHTLSKGIRELVDMFRATEVQQRILRKRLEKQAKELQAIKAGMGLK